VTLKPITTFAARAVAIPVENIDTDQIIPARFLKVTDKHGLGEAAFADWRYLPDGSPHPEFVLNSPEVQGARILVAGDNFGCGSSREHAPWALLGYGFQAVISTYFADIFKSNSLKNGLLPLVVDAETHRRVLDLIQSDPDAELEVDLSAQTLRLPDGTSATFPIDPFAKHCLMNGVDQFGFLLAASDAISAFEATHPSMVATVR
jgi:3-isopropylmalate/(R)-2-methylmalate dehydratase small subunit